MGRPPSSVVIALQCVVQVLRDTLVPTGIPAEVSCSDRAVWHGWHLLPNSRSSRVSTGWRIMRSCAAVLGTARISCWSEAML